METKSKRIPSPDILITDTLVVCVCVRWEDDEYYVGCAEDKDICILLLMHAVYPGE